MPRVCKFGKHSQNSLGSGGKGVVLMKKDSKGGSVT